MTPGARRVRDGAAIFRVSRSVLLCFIAVMLLATACTGTEIEQRALFEAGQYQSLWQFEGPSFRPVAPVEAMAIVWLEQGARDPSSREDPSPQRARASEDLLVHCEGVADPDTCTFLLTDAFFDVAVLDDDERPVDSLYRNDNCINCTPEFAYIFAVSADDAQVVSPDEALDLLGVIDAPGEAIVVLGQAAVVRPVGDGYELVTTSELCNPDGPRRRTWTVAADATITQGSEWMENSGDDCADI